MPNGHEAGSTGLLVNDSGRAKDSVLDIPAVGAGGRAEPPGFLNVVGGGIYGLRVLASGGLCIWPIGGMTHAGNPLVQAFCDSSQIQKWYEDPAPGGFLMRNSATGLCMETFAASTSDFMPVVENTCTGAPSQVYNWSGNRLIASHSGKCMGSIFGGLSQGLTQYTCGSTSGVTQLERVAN